MKRGRGGGAGPEGVGLKEEGEGGVGGALGEGGGKWS